MNNYLTEKNIFKFAKGIAVIIAVLCIVVLVKILCNPEIISFGLID